MTDNSGRTTEAELQIERLKRLKAEKEIKDKQARDTMFAAPEPQIKAPQPEAVKEQVHDIKHSHKPGAKALRTARIDKANFDALHALVSSVNKRSGKNRINKDKVINLLIKRLLELKLDTDSLDKDSLEKLIGELGHK